MEKFCYHGIGENLLKYESIMKHGIVSTEMAEGIYAYNKNGGVNHNGNDRISVAIPHDVSRWGALNLYILGNGIAFKIENCDYVLASKTQNASEYFDEAFIDKKIPVESITGIIVNSKMSTKKISELSTIGTPANSEVVKTTINIMEQLKSKGIDEEKFQGINELIGQYERIYNDLGLEFMEQDVKLATIKEKIDSILSKAVEEHYKKECKKDEVSVLDVINLYNDRKLPVYNENDIINECKGRKVQQEIELNENESLQIKEEQANEISKSIEEGSFINKTFGIKRVIDLIKNRFKAKEIESGKEI